MKRANVKRSMLCGVLVTALVGIPMVASADFSGYYAPGNWTTTYVPNATDDQGTVNTAGAPSSVAITGSNTGNFGVQSRIEYTIAAQADGTVFFDWAYLTNDTGAIDPPPFPPFYDPAGYIDGGVPQQLTNDGGASSQSGGPVSFAVSAGEIFGFYVESLDNFGGDATLTISSFRASDDGGSVPEPASLALMALGLLGMGLVRRRRTH